MHPNLETANEPPEQLLQSIWIVLFAMIEQKIHIPLLIYAG